MVSFSAGGSTLMAWKRRSRERSFSMYLRVLGRRGRADAADLSARECGLEDVCRVQRTLRGTRPDQRVQLVDEHDDVRVLRELLHDRLQPFLELAAVFRAGDDQRDVEGEDAFVGQKVGDVSVDDLLRQAFHDRGLADAGLADEHCIVLRATAEDLLHALELVLAADERIELVLHRRVGEVAAEFGEQRRFLDPRERGLLVQQLNDVLAHGVKTHPLLHQDAGGDRALFSQDAEQQMLGADVVMQEPVGFFSRKLQHPLRLRAERDLDRRRDLLAEHGPPFDFLANVFEGEMGSRKDAAGQPLALADQSEKKVLGLDRNAAELAGLITGKEENPSRPFRIAFEHPACLGVRGLGVTK